MDRGLVHSIESTVRTMGALCYVYYEPNEIQTLIGVTCAGEGDTFFRVNISWLAHTRGVIEVTQCQRQVEACMIAWVHNYGRRNTHLEKPQRERSFI